jgi:5-methylcytosine-specific restriction endonuclease McrA
VFERDGGRCTFVGDDGRRCESDWNLQIDHIVPYAKGGDNSPENLRLLCARHNRLAAEREFGKERMEKYHRRE